MRAAIEQFGGRFTGYDELDEEPDAPLRPMDHVATVYSRESEAEEGRDHRALRGREWRTRAELVETFGLAVVVHRGRIEVTGAVEVAIDVPTVTQGSRTA